MTNRILAAATVTLFAASPAAFAQAVAPIASGVVYENGAVTTDNELIDRAAMVSPTDADAVLTDAASLDPVVIQNGEVVSLAQPIDMDLTPVAGTNYAFTNAAGQVVIMAPNSRDIAVVKR
ncbi:hypothetical protein [Jannaschia sp. 2305UL9-9]|uniref:hypothetical protein n=1 Tax=Jannaschia sp. 2305UL9-9 TaxID=3121638 RepID=UPI003527F7CE